MVDLVQRLRQLARSGTLDLPLPGRGHTAERHIALLELAREDLSLGRLIEAHTDARAIIGEAGGERASTRVYGVWASESPAGTLTVRRGGDDTVLLDGAKQFCTGASLLDAALVTAFDGDSQQ